MKVRLVWHAAGLFVVGALTLGGIKYCSNTVVEHNKYMERIEKQRNEKLKFFGLKKDEFYRLSEKRQKEVLDSCDVALEKKMIYNSGLNKGQELIRDSIKLAQEKLANKAFSAKVKTSLKALK